MFKLQTPEIKGLLQQADSGNTSDRLRCGLWTHHATLHSYVIQTQQSRTDINRLWTAQRTGDAITICSLNIYNKCSSSFSLCVTAQCAKQRSCSLTFRKTPLQDEDRKVFPVLFHDSETASNDMSGVLISTHRRGRRGLVLGGSGSVLGWSRWLLNLASVDFYLEFFNSFINKQFQLPAAQLQ